MRPALDYFGGKWKHANKIIEHFPKHKTFIDVFCGAASITIRKPRSKNEIINDINSELTDFFFVIREHNLELKELLRKTPYSREEYLRCRENSDKKIEQARRTIVKSWFGIGDSLDNKTGFRVSLSQGGSTTDPWLTYIDYLHVYAERLRGVIIENLDFEELVSRYDKEDTLFYFDPPYMLSTRSKKHAYRFDWKDSDHDRLFSILKKLKGMYVLSGYESEKYNSIEATKHTFEATSQFGKKVECLWIKPTPQEKGGE